MKETLRKLHASQVFWGAVAVAAILFVFRSNDGLSGGALAASEGKPMPDIAMPDLNGHTWKLSEHRGEVALVNFWATWCPPCREETPGFVNLANEYKGRLTVAGVSMDDDASPVRQFVNRFRIPYPILLPSAESPFMSGIEALPTTYLVDKHGLIAKIYTGAAEESVVRADVDRLLAEP
jgi:cytochrome c biogenesis protein CcmG/thiol:disulfide interchange protein DsbE